MRVIPHAVWRFDGEVGRRIAANERHWLLRAPDANPGMIHMFRRRERALPYDAPVPWAGEFAGKYLISAVQACRMSDTESLREHVRAFVRELASSQAEDGYLGPWPKHERLLGHWDLWGHYHCILGLLMWHDETGDPEAFECARRAADCICRVYLDGARRPIDAGTPMINLSIIHALGGMYRRTGDDRYLGLMRRIEEDMQQDGDWLRLGAQGTPYYRLPGGGTRWESLHIVQGLAELYRITGEDRYKTAVLNLWRSIRDFDRHPSGAFSTHEQAFGTVYTRGPIETCCSVAWEALTIDVLQLTGAADVADELELTTWNQVLAAQHPSGSWWTYDTPLDGVRNPSFHDIRFQARPGTPELNCCSVNGPRGLGMLTEWAVMETGDGWAVNYYGPSTVQVGRKAGVGVTLSQETRYPVEGDVLLRVTPEAETTFALHVRIPAWSKETRVTINGRSSADVAEPGTYLTINRTWRPGDCVALAFDMSPRFWVGQDERYGHAALYRGPLLLSFDAQYNAFDVSNLPAIDLRNLVLEPAFSASVAQPASFPPIGLWRVCAATGEPVLLCDFASAGAHGTDYVSWLPAVHVPPPKARLITPEDGMRGRPGAILFAWQPSNADGCTFEIVIARDAACKDVAVHCPGIASSPFVLDRPLPEGTYYWKIAASNPEGAVDNHEGSSRFVVDDDAPHAFFTIGEGGVLAASALDGGGAPSTGILEFSQDVTPAPDRHSRANGAVRFNGTSSALRYRVPLFPDTDYSFLGWVCPEGLPVGAIQQVFSAWCAGMDDPLRVALRANGVFAGIEAGSAYGTPVAPLENGRWRHVAAVKSGGTLTLYLDGAAVHEVAVPERIRTMSQAVGIGFNPRFSGGEHFKGLIDDFQFLCRAVSANEVAQAASER